MNPKILIYIFFLFLLHTNLHAQKVLEKEINLKITFPQNFEEDRVYAKISFQKQEVIIPTLDTCLKVNLRKAKQYQIMIEARGYTTIIIPLKDDTLLNNQTINVTIIPRHKLLQEVIVRPNNRVHFRGDTLIIDIDNIKVKPHGNTTELLKKLPSVYVGSWGNIEIMGKSVESVTINGKQIFGGNAKATLETIKADMIEHLEVTQSKFNQNGIDLNLKLKIGRDNGWFGETTGGLGSKETRKEDLRMNRINPKYFLNFFLNENTTSEKILTANASQHIQSMVQYNDMSGAYSITNNQISFLFPSYESKSNVDVPKLDKSKGINQSLSGGINFTHTGAKSSWFAFALGDFEKQSSLEKTTQTNIFTEKIRQSQYTEISKNQSVGQLWSAIYGNLKPSKFDILKTFTLFQWNDNNQKYSENAKTLLLKENEDTLKNSSSKYSFPVINSLRVIQKVSWVHRYPKSGFVTSFFGSYLYDTESVRKEYENSLFESSSLSKSNHHYLTKNTPEQYLNFHFVQSIPITSKWLFEVKNIFSYNIINSSQFVLKFAEKEGTFRDTISNLSNQKFYMKDFQNQIHTNIFLKTNRSDLILGINSWYWKSQRSLLQNDYSDFKFLPTLYWKWNYSTGKNLFLYINSNQQLPTFQQIFPLRDSSSIQRISMGNLYLKNYSKFQIGASLITSYKSITIHPVVNYERFDNVASVSSKLGSNSSIVQSFVQNGEIQRLNFGLRLYRLPRTTLTWSVSNNIFLNKSSTFWEDNVTSTSSYTGIFSGGLKWNPNSKISYSFDIRTSISGIFNNKQSILKNDLTLTGEHEISQKTYFDFSAEFMVNRTIDKKFLNYPILDVSLSQFAFKNNSLKIGLQMKNILNVTSIYDNFTTTNSQVEYFYNRMPRFLLLSCTFYLERWSK